MSLKHLPKIPAIVLLIVIGLWAWTRWGFHRQVQSIAPIRGPAVALQAATQGMWEFDWPEWPTKRGKPYVAAFGLPFIGFGAHYDPPVFLRVHPRDAVETGPSRPIDADGWFEAGEDHDFDTVAWLEAGRVERIEYRVGSSASSDTEYAYLQIRGIGDLLVRRDLGIGMALADSAALLIVFVLGVWVAIRSALRARRRNSMHRSAGIGS